MAERGRLFAALPKDIERIWILSQNAKELKDGIHALRKRVQKYRDDALLAWEESKQKNVHFDKWGVPCNIAPKVKTTEETSEKSGNHDEETTEIQDDNVWEIPLNEDNPDVQVVMKVSPRKAIIQHLKGDEGDTVKSLSGKENSLAQKQSSSESPFPENQPPLSNDNLTVVDDQDHSHAHPKIVETSPRQEKTLEKQNDDGIIRVHVEAAGKVRNQVKILFGGENDADTNKKKMVNAVSVAESIEHSGEKKPGRVPRRDDTRKRKAKKHKKKVVNQKEEVNISKSTSNTHVKKHSGAPGSKYAPVKKDGKANVARKNTEEKEQKMDYKPLPVKDDEKPDLNPGIAGYPTEKSSRDNHYKGLLNKHRARKISNHKDLKDVPTDTRSKEGSFQYIKYSTVVDLDHKTDSTKCDSIESNSGASGTKSNGRTVQVLSQTKRNGSVLESSIDIKVPKSSQRHQSPEMSKAVSKPSNPTANSRKPFLKQILDFDMTNKSDCTADSSVEYKDAMVSNQKMTQAGIDATDLLDKGEKIKVSYETFQALKTMIGKIDTSTSKNNEFKENVTVVASSSAEVGSEHASQQILDCNNEDQATGLHLTESIPGNTKQDDSFLGASLWNSPKQEHRSNLQIDRRKHYKGSIEDIRNIADSFLGAPLMSSTQQGEADNIKAAEVEESNHVRRAIWSSTSDTDSVTSSRLGLDYSSRLRTADEPRDGNQIDMTDTDLKQTVPIRETSHNLTNGLQQENLLSINYYPRASDPNNSGSTQSEGKHDTGYNTLKAMPTGVGLTCVGNVDQSHSDAEHGELGKSSTLERHRESLHTNNKLKHIDNKRARSSFESSSASERLKYGVEGENRANTAELRTERKTAIQGTQRGKPKHSIHSSRNTTKERSKHKSSSSKNHKPQDSRNTESRSLECKGEYRIQEIIRECNSRDGDREYRSRRQYISTTEYSSDGNGTNSIHIDTSVICQSEPSANNRSSSSDEREMANDNMSNNNRKVQVSKKFNEQTKHLKTLESSESSRPECSESSDQSLLRCQSRTLSKKKKYRSRSKGRYWEKTEANLSELVKHYSGLHGNPS